MEYKLTDSPTVIKDCFEFLKESYGFKLIEDISSNAGVLIIYQNDFGKVGINFDYRDDDFNIDLVKGSDMQYPNDAAYWNEIKPLESLIKKYEADFDIEQIQSNNRKYVEAVKLSAEMLKKYGDKVLRGEEWI